MPSKTPLVLSILKRAAMTAGTVDVNAPASGMMAPVTNTAQPQPGVNQLPPATPQHTATTAMPPNSTDTQALKASTTGPQTQNPGIAAAAQAAGKGSGRSGGNQLGGTKGNPGVQQSTLNSTASRFGKAAYEIPTRDMQPQQAPSVDDTVRKKMQYRWKDKMQKIDQGMSKLELQREQAKAEMQLEEEQLRQNEQLKAEQKQFDEQVKAQKQQQQVAQQMPQNPLGAMQQQQGGMARQMYPQQKMAALQVLTRKR